MDLAPFKSLISTSQIICWAGLGEPENIFTPSDSRVSVGLMGRVRSLVFLLLLLLLMDSHSSLQLYAPSHGGLKACDPVWWVLLPTKASSPCEGVWVQPRLLPLPRPHQGVLMKGTWLPGPCMSGWLADGCRYVVFYISPLVFNHNIALCQNL